MSEVPKSKIMEIEKIVDSVIQKNEIFKYNPYDCIELALGLVDKAWSMHLYYWYGGLEILVPLLLQNDTNSKTEPPLEKVAEALELAQNYYFLRDYFYYSYNLQDAIKWDFETKNKIRIEINDSSLPLQLFLELNNSFLGSRDFFLNPKFKKIEKRTKTLVNSVENEFSLSPNISQAYSLCFEEAKCRVDNQLLESFLSPNNSFDLYTVAQFKEVYTHVLARFILRRYFLEKRERKGEFVFPSCIIPNRNEFTDALAEATNINKETVQIILADMTLDKFKISKQQSISLFPLIHNPYEDLYYVFPNIVCFSHCFNGLRRLWASKDPANYGEKIAPYVNDNFMKYISNLFKEKGFVFVISGLELKKQSASLTDIDVLALWDEPHFGYIVFACELKSTIPEYFGKNYVSGVGPKGYLTKAVSQIETIHSYLGGKEFANLIKKYLPKHLFKYGLYALNFLVITSHNTGVFVATDKVKVIDFETLSQILKFSNGDILHLLKLLDRKNMEKICTKNYRILTHESHFGELDIQIPLVGLAQPTSYSLSLRTLGLKKP
jgi:hypothetical protein